MNKKIFAAICASAMALAACTACGDSSEPDSSSVAESSSEAEVTTVPEEEETEESSAAETAAAVDVADIDFEDAVEAGSGDAILAIVDGQWYVQYWGTTDDLLTYDAGVVHIEGDGDYTVSVNAGTKGAQYDITGDPENGYECEGLEFACIKVFDGTTLFPDMSIEIKEVRVDGKAIELSAKNYTSSDDGKEMRANIYNHFVSSIPEDAHTADGAVAADDTAYSAQIVDPSAFAKWTKVEVDFTVTGTGAAAEGGDEATEDAPAEEEATEEAAE